MLLPPCTTLNIWKLSDACFAAAAYRKGFMKPRDGLPAANSWSFSRPTTPSRHAPPKHTIKHGHEHDGGIAPTYCASHAPAKIGPDAEVPPDTSKSPFCTTKMLLPKADTSLSVQEFGHSTHGEGCAALQNKNDILLDEELERTSTARGVEHAGGWVRGVQVVLHSRVLVLGTTEHGAEHACRRPAHRQQGWLSSQDVAQRLRPLPHTHTHTHTSGGESSASVQCAGHFGEWGTQNVDAEPGVPQHQHGTHTINMAPTRSASQCEPDSVQHQT